MQGLGTRIELAQEELEQTEDGLQGYCYELLDLIKEATGTGDWGHNSTRADFERLIGLIESNFEKCDDIAAQIERMKS